MLSRFAFSDVTNPQGPMFVLVFLNPCGRVVWHWEAAGPANLPHHSLSRTTTGTVGRSAHRSRRTCEPTSLLSLGANKYGVESLYSLVYQLEYRIVVYKTVRHSRAPEIN